MHRKIQIAGVILLLLLTALAAVTVKLYRYGRDQDSALNAQIVNRRELKNMESLRNASDALQNLQLYAANYLLTGRADSLKSYGESLQDWQYESESLNLVSGNDARTAFLHDFSETGNKVASETAAIVSLYSAGSRDAALVRLRANAPLAGRDKISKITEADQTASDRIRKSTLVNGIQARRRLIYCAGGLYLLGFLSLVVLFSLLRIVARARV
ncbi:MAG TPA: hypothetical protein VGM43_19825 [Bryobacteraceae bacterium]|jgi:CHASE3 domain sensor protein